MRSAWIAVAVLAVLAPSAAGAPETCSGDRVTISFRDPGVGRTIVGTPGRDVIQGGPGHEKIDGGGGDDTICGGGGDDVIDGGPGRDELIGQDGSDTFVGPGLAEDVITGGRQDFDTADYRRSPVGVQVNMSNGLVQGAGAPVRGGILGVEDVEGTDHDDVLIGNAAVNRLNGGGGDDYVDGRGGADYEIGGVGADTLSYAKSAEKIRLNVGDHEVRVGEDKDRMSGFEVYIGSGFDDRLVGSDLGEKLVGGAGDDTIKGLGGDDDLEGGPGDDTIFPGEGDDLADGGANGPVLNTGHPGDVVSYVDDAPHGLTGSFDFEAYLVPDPHFGTPPEAIGVGQDALTGIESIRGPKKGGSYIEGDDGPNVLVGGSRIDVLVGNGGNDLLFGLGSNDDLDGGAGDDYLDGGEPHTDGDSDKLDGGDGDDTCLGAREEYRSGCETVG